MSRSIAFQGVQCLSCRDGRIEQIQKPQLLFWGEKRSLEGIARQFPHMLVAESELILDDLILARERGRENGWIITIQSNF
jgi:hypothetical protein